MGDNDQTTGLSADPAANPPDAAAAEKGKGRAVDYTPAEEVSMGEEEEESYDEDSAIEEEDLVRRIASTTSAQLSSAL